MRLGICHIAPEQARKLFARVRFRMKDQIGKEGFKPARGEMNRAGFDFGPKRPEQVQAQGSGFFRQPDGRAWHSDFPRVRCDQAIRTILPECYIRMGQMSKMDLLLQSRCAANAFSSVWPRYAAARLFDRR